METLFMPLDYDYFDWEGRNYIRIIGRNEKGKRLCIIDKFNPYLWAVLKKGTSEKQIKELIRDIERIKIKGTNRVTKVIKTEVHDKNFLGKQVKAVKIFISNYKDAHEVADNLDFPEIDARRGYDVPLLTKYIIESKLIPLRWYKIKGKLLNGTLEFGGIDRIEVDECYEAEKIEEAEELDFNPKILAFDIEVGEFGIGKGEVLMISLVSKNFRKVLSWKKCEKPAEYVECFKDEASMLEAFVEYVRKESPDILVGYFSDGFDMPYLRARAEKNKVRLALGLDNRQPAFARGRIPSASITGIVHLDIFRFIESVYSQYLTSETLGLNDVASELLGEGKKDFDVAEHVKNKKQEWKDFFEYNLQDSILTYKLAEKLWPDMLEFSRIIQEPLFEITRSSMSQIVESYIIHNLEKYNEIEEKRPLHDEIGLRRQREKYEGAFVFQPTAGLYENLAIFDFTSMHASIIVSYNLSKTTLLEKKEEDCYESPELELEGKKERFYFSKNPGFFPNLLGEIVKLRKKYKKELREKPDPIKKARSNAYKLLANAYYGYMGFFGARYYSIEAAASTLAFVRKFNKWTMDKVSEQGYGVVFGDSVSGDTRVIINKEGEIAEEEIKNLFDRTDEVFFEKEYNFKKNLMAMTLKEGKSVFRPIKSIMRHKTDKKMYRVWFTNHWYIDVTEDHSLIGYQAKRFNQSRKNKENVLNKIIEIKPQEIGKKVNSLICLKKIPREKLCDKGFSKEVYEFMGYFLGDGNFPTNKKFKKDYDLGVSLGEDKEEIITKLILPLIKQGYIKKFRESKTRKGDVRLNGSIVDLISKNMKGINDKKIPSWMFNETENHIANFLNGLFSADGCVILREGRPIIKVTSINQEHTKDIRKLLYLVGVSNSIFRENTCNKYKSKDKVYSNGSHSINIIIKDRAAFVKKIGFLLDRKDKLSKIKNKTNPKSLIENLDFDLQQSIKIEEIPHQDFVYDIEIEDTHTFFANYVLVHNTDSCGFTLNDKTKEQTKEFLEKLNSELPGIMELELEDFYKRGIWVKKRTGDFGAKKKYALIDERGKLKIRGFETVRRDWCDLARQLQNKVLQTILEDGNEKKALELIKETIKKIKNREVEKKDIMIHTQLKKPLDEYKSITPHVIAARKIKEKGLPIDLGMLLEYFIAETKPGSKKKLVREKVKLPDEKGEYNIKYYLERQILPAVENIIEVFGINLKEIIEGKKQMKLGEF